MTGTSWLSVHDYLDGRRHIIGYAICVASRHVALNSSPHANRRYTRVIGAFDVDLLTANQKRTGKIYLLISRRFDDHSRRGLAALGMLSGRIRAIISRVNQIVAKLPQHFCLDLPILIERKESAPDPA